MSSAKALAAAGHDIVCLLCDDNDVWLTPEYYPAARALPAGASLLITELVIHVWWPVMRSIPTDDVEVAVRTNAVNGALMGRAVEWYTAAEIVVLRPAIRPYFFELPDGSWAPSPEFFSVTAELLEARIPREAKRVALLLAYQRDVRLRLCSLAARGLWIEALPAMSATPGSRLIIDGIVPSEGQLANLFGATTGELRRLRAELLAAGVLTIDDAGAWCSEALAQAESRRAVNQTNGAKGGNLSLRRGGGDNRKSTEQAPPVALESVPVAALQVAARLAEWARTELDLGRAVSAFTIQRWIEAGAAEDAIRAVISGATAAKREQVLTWQPGSLAMFTPAVLATIGASPGAQP